jgi:Zn finger protein HypA/HybF involved in hydrogenase expression
MREKLNMSTFFKRTHIRLKPEITSGVCPHCEDMSNFVSIVSDNYRCMNCGSDVEQKINGVIKYLPIGQDKVIENGPEKA